MKFDVWITKYALTNGILHKQAVPCGNPNMIQVGNTYFHGEGNDWHRTLEGAQRKAETMRVRKIASLEKSIEKFKKLNFLS